MGLEKKLSGIVVPVITPFNNDSIDLDGVANLTYYLKNSGVHGLFYLGETGEFRFLSFTDKKLVIDYAARQAFEKKVIVGTTGRSFDETVELSEYAYKKGISSVVLATELFPDNTAAKFVPDFVNAMKKRGVDNPQFVIYDNPEITRQSMVPRNDFQNLVMGKYGKYVEGYKDSSSDNWHLKVLTEIRDSSAPWLSVMLGSENALIQNPWTKFDGLVSGTANYDPHLLVRIFEKIKRGVAYEELRPDFEELNAHLNSYTKGTVPEIKRRVHNIKIALREDHTINMISSHEMAPLKRAA